MIRFFLGLVFRGQTAEPEVAYPCSTMYDMTHLF